MGAHAYAPSNIILPYAPTVFTWSNGAVTNRSFLNDGRMDKKFLVDALAASGINVIVDVGSGGAITCVAVAVLNSNCAVQKTDATLMVEASSSATFAADVNVAKAASTLYSTTSPRNKDHVLQFAAISKRYWRLTWTWTGTVTNFSIGEIYFVENVRYTQLSRRSIYGSGETMDAKVALSEMQYGGQRGLFQAGPIRQLDTNWEDLNATARDELYTMHTASNFGAKPFLFANSYEATATAAAVAEQECLFGRLQRPGFRWAEKDFALYTPDGFALRSEGREAGA